MQPNRSLTHSVSEHYVKDNCFPKAKTLKQYGQLHAQITATDFVLPLLI